MIHAHPFRRRAFAALLILTVTVLTGCQSLGGAQPSLYHALGEREGIADLNERLLLIVAEDERIAGQFQYADIDRLHRMLTDYVCERVGGPCVYTGANMVDVHRNRQISSADFNALVEDLVYAMEAKGYSTRTQNRLLAKLAPLRTKIVNAPPPPSPEIERLILGGLPFSGYSTAPSESGL